MTAKGGGVSSRPVTLPYDQLGVGPPVVLPHAEVADRSMRSDVLPPPGFRAIIPDLPTFDFLVLVAAGEDAKESAERVNMAGVTASVACR